MTAKYSGGCAHVHVTSSAEPIDNHECHCNVCKSVTGQHTTHVAFFNYGDLKVDHPEKIKRVPFNANNPGAPDLSKSNGSPAPSTDEAPSDFAGTNIEGNISNRPSTSTKSSSLKRNSLESLRSTISFSSFKTKTRSQPMMYSSQTLSHLNYPFTSHEIILNLITCEGRTWKQQPPHLLQEPT